MDMPAGRLWPHRPQALSRMSGEGMHAGFVLTALLVFLAVSAPLIVAIWRFGHCRYEASGRIRVQPTASALVRDTDLRGSVPSYDRYVDSQIAIVRGPVVLTRVLERQDVKDTAWRQAEPPFWPMGQTTPLARLQQALSVRRVGDSELIDVAIEAPTAADAAAIVNAVLKEYIGRINETAGADQTYRALAETAAALRQEIGALRRSVASRQQRLGSRDPAELVARKRARLDRCEEQRGELDRTLAVARWRHDTLTKKRQARRNGNGSGNGRPDPASSEEARSVTPPSAPSKTDPAAAALAAEIEACADRIGELEHRRQLLLRDVEHCRRDWQSAFDGAQALHRDLETLRQKQKRYDEVTERLSQKRIESQAPWVVGIQSYAVTPTEPAGDPRLLLTVLALLVGAGAGVAFAYRR